MLATIATALILCTAVPDSIQTPSDSIARCSLLPATFKDAKPNRIEGAEHIEAFMQRYAAATDTLPHNSLRIIHIGDSHVRGKFFPQAVGESLGAVMTVKPTRKVVRGRRVRLPLIDPVDTLTSGPVVMDYLGINGAAAQRFIEDDVQQRIAAFRPDMIIVSFGTNEAHARFDSLQHIATLRQLADRLLAANPGATLLFTTPPGSYLTGKPKRWKDKRGRWHSKKTYKPNHRTAQVANCIAAFTHEQGFALWNLFDIAGGEPQAQQNWWDANLMQNDHIHYTQQGYELMGRMLGEALRNTPPPKH